MYLESSTYYKCSKSELINHNYQLINHLFKKKKMMTTASSESHLEVKSWPKHDKYLVSSHKLKGYYQDLIIKKGKETKHSMKCTTCIIVYSIECEW